MDVLHVRHEIEGHIADRLMEALWRESLHIVNDGIATTEEVDKAFTHAAGLRYAQYGPFMTFHLAGMAWYASYVKTIWASLKTLDKTHRA